MEDSVLKRNNVNILGSGTKTMIFAHGFGCNQNMWRFVAPVFQEEYRIILFDFVGSGKSDISAYHPVRYSELNGYAQDVLDICEALDLKDAVFVGHSVGAMIGVLASIREPERFSHLILVGPSPRYINDPPDYIGGFSEKDILDLMDLMKVNYAGWANHLAPAIMGNPGRPELAGELADSFCSTDPEIAEQFARATFLADNRGDLAMVTVPSLILQCAQDIIAPIEVGAYLHLHMPGSTLQLMEATGHCPHISHPEETARLIGEYLSVDASSLRLQTDALQMNPEIAVPGFCGALSLTDEHTILTGNDTLHQMLGYEIEGLRGCQFDSLLTRSSRIYFQLHFSQLIQLNGRIDEMHLTLRTIQGEELPVILRAVRQERGGRPVYECILTSRGPATGSEPAGSALIL